MLEIHGLSAGYRRGSTVVQSASLTVAPGELTCVMGHNGAGKTTLLRAAFGLLRAQTGEVRVNGRSVGTASSSERVRNGISYSPPGRAVLPTLTIGENLNAAADVLRLRHGERNQRRDSAFALFPLLAERLDQRAGTLSGGQQRMLSIAMVLMQKPTFVLLDEPSLGLSPLMVQTMYDAIGRLRTDLGIGALVVEQTLDLEVLGADSLYVMRLGRLSKIDEPLSGIAMEDVWERL